MSYLPNDGTCRDISFNGKLDFDLFNHCAGIAAHNWLLFLLPLMFIYVGDFQQYF